MFSYYLKLGVRSLRRNPALTALMVLTLAIGVAASVSTLTILHVMSSNPIPQKSERLFVPLVDNGPLEGDNPADKEHNRDDQLSYIDAQNFLKSGQGERRTALYGIAAPIEPARHDLPVISAQGTAPTRDFFAMFDVPFLYGQPWSEADDKAAADVVVLSGAMAEKLFGAVNPVGQRLRMMGHEFQVVGVLRAWQPLPKFYALVGGPGAFGQQDDIMLPFATAIRHKADLNGGMSCRSRREPGWQGLLDSECTWLGFFFETSTGAGRADLQNYLDNYASDQRKLGRLKRKGDNQLFDVMEWLEHMKVVGNDSRLAAWLAFGFLLLCLVNTIGLLLAKFSVRASEVGVRRALGAARRDIFQQFLTETAVVGLAGGLLGLLLSFGALALIAMSSQELSVVAHMDFAMLGLTFSLSLLAALLAGLLPTWRACQVTPAIQLKSQ
ncbi:ABC transporter permease [Massilia psychrophila]|uniref:ABC transporter permease n=1 Tax=Massilia psychrophila TaxID=1603353 RepID=A0A2G8SZL7_9BURK|nr:ABC transporter permease [Massilia psychrophila]PIL39257.1 ABC transporter permease [Massilia psychrophila]GGE87332.1 ABC transporter ATP-binding protein [Massilia psychrophila]